jgi:hypothetical protein
MLSRTTITTLMALNSAPDVVVVSIRFLHNDSTAPASVMPRNGVARFTVPAPTLRKMVRDGLLTTVGTSIYPRFELTEYILTDAGRAALAAALPA